MKEKMYLGKKIIELNIHEKRFKKAMQLMKIHIMLEKAEKELKTLTDNVEESFRL